MFGPVGWNELVVILIIVLVIFGPKRLPELAEAMGKSIRKFKEMAQPPNEEQTDWIKVDLHIHTLDDPKDALDYSAHELLERARALGFRVLAITLHDAVFDRAQRNVDVGRSSENQRRRCGVLPGVPLRSRVVQIAVRDA